MGKPTAKGGGGNIKKRSTNIQKRWGGVTPAERGVFKQAQADLLGDEYELGGGKEQPKDYISLNPEISDDEDDLSDEPVLGLDGDGSSDDVGDDSEEDEDEYEDAEDLQQHAGKVSAQKAKQLSKRGAAAGSGGLEEEALYDEMIQQGGRAAMLARAAKALGDKLKLQRGEDDEEEEEEEEEAKGKKGKKGKAADEEEDERDWGANKRAYYADDSEDEEGSDEEAAAEQEAEALRLQRERAARLKAADFGLDDDEEEEEEEGEEDEGEEEEEEETLGKAAQKAPVLPAAAPTSGGVEVEAVAKDLGALSSEAKLGALLADAPELLQLLADLQQALGEVRHRVGPLLSEVKSGRLATREGLSYLEAKHLLLAHYCASITFYCLLKAEGRAVRDHPVIGRLVELRSYLEKLRPIDKQLSYQIDKLLRAAAAAAEQEGADDEAAEAEGDDLTKYGPRPHALVPKAGTAAARQPAAAAAAEDGEAAPVGVYRPPKLNPVSMEDDEERRAGGALSRDERRQLQEVRRRAARSAVVRELAQEIAGAPEEQRMEVPGFDNMAALKQRQRLEARSAAEEDIMTRVPLSREEAKKLKSARRRGMATSALIDDFADEVADLVDVAQGADGAAGGASRLTDLFSRHKVSQRFGGEATLAKPHGGDEDLPRRAALHERRAKYDAVVAKRSAAAAQMEGGEDDMMDGGDDGYDLSGGRGRAGKRQRGGEEDDFYTQAKESAAERKRTKSSKYSSAPTTLPPLPDQRTAVGGARAITNEIEKNRGLTPHRRKDIKNPRKKHRVKFAQANVRRKGQVQSVRAHEGGGYGGEATGIKKRVAKGTRLG